MTRIGVTGHRDIPAAALESVRSGIRAALCRRSVVEALSSLAAGADQLFADIALSCGVPVTAVIPGMDYERSLGTGDTLTAYRRLLTSSVSQVRLPREASDEAAYRAAGRWIVDHVDSMVAVWDGRPARGPGGTGDVVAYAHRVGVPVTVVWSPGVRRQ